MQPFDNFIPGRLIFNDSRITLYLSLANDLGTLSAYLPMKCPSILRAILPTLGKDLYAVVPLTQIDMNLAVFAIDFLLNAHSAMAHVKTVLDTASFEPCLPAHFDSKLGLNRVQNLASIGSTGGIWQEPSFCGLRSLDCHSEIILDLQNRGKDGITQSIGEVWIEDQWLIVLENESREPLCLTRFEPLINAFEVASVSLRQ